MQFGEEAKETLFRSIIEIDPGIGLEGVGGEIQTRCQSFVLREIRPVELLEMFEILGSGKVCTQRREMLENRRELILLGPRGEMKVFDEGATSLAELIQPSQERTAILSTGEQRVFEKDVFVGDQSKRGEIEDLHDDPEQR